MYTWLLETMDPQDSEFQRYLRVHAITAELTGVVFGQPGGGEEVKFSATTREALVGMFKYFFASGDDESDAELIAEIEELS